jgi:hypothetical protein
MAEEKILIPPYKRTGACERCGADVYSPDVKQSGSGWPLMSACICKHGPKTANRAVERRQAAAALQEKRAQAA